MLSQSLTPVARIGFSVLFKLRQLNDIDDLMLQRLTVRFTELDLEGSGMLDIGLHIPSAQQVQVLLKIAKATGRDTQLWAIWKEMREGLVKQELAEREAKNSPSLELAETKAPPAKKPIRLIACHMFVWSRTLWREAMWNTTLLGWYEFSIARKFVLHLVVLIFSPC